MPDVSKHRGNLDLGGGMVAYGRQDGTQEYMPLRIDERGAVEMVNPRLVEQMDGLCKKMDEMIRILKEMSAKMPMPTSAPVVKR